MLVILQSTINEETTTMTPHEADKAIKSGAPLTVRSKGFNETFVLVIESRNRWTVYGKYRSTESEQWFSSGAFDRADLQIVKIICT